MIRFEKLGVVLRPENELTAKFNSGAFLKDGVVHLLYRYAEIARPTGGGPGVNYVKNYIAHARMTPEGKLLLDDPSPVFERTTPYEEKGMEDARIFTLDGRILITYTAWDGRRARVAFAEANGDFTLYKKLGVVPAQRFDKDAFLFPERIGGKIAYVHRFEPNIQIEYFDELEDLFDDGFWRNYTPDARGSVVLKGEQPWEEGKIGGSLPPIRTPDGWLFIYHSVAYDRRPFCYRAGIALLDLNDPHKILARLPYPVLEPTEDYETTGDVDNVVFPCGGYEHNGYLYLVYGGADKVTALARCPMKDILEELKKYPVKDPNLLSEEDGILIRKERLTANEYIDFLHRTDLGEQYPKERFDERVKRLVENVSVSLTARREDGLLVGALFGITDFSYWLFVTDLGVDRAYERRGIGRRLMKEAHALAGGEKDIAVYLVANEKAVPFYEKLGMKRADDVMKYNHIEWTEFKVE